MLCIYFRVGGGSGGGGGVGGGFGGINEMPGRVGTVTGHVS